MERISLAYSVSLATHMQSWDVIKYNVSLATHMQNWDAIKYNVSLATHMQSWGAIKRLSTHNSAQREGSGKARKQDSGDRSQLSYPHSPGLLTIASKNIDVHESSFKLSVCMLFFPDC